MLSLQDREWKELFIGNLFEVKRPKPRSEKQYQPGEIPFIASGNMNNGVIKCCTPQNEECLDRGNCITVSPVDGSAFYQEFNFLGRGGAGSSILLLYNNNLNRYSGLFISRMIRQTCSKYCYGKMGNQESIKREKIMLPVDEYGPPDYSFMEQYIKERERQLIQKYKNFIGKNTQPGGVLTDLKSVKWEKFLIGEIFDYFMPGKSKGLNHLNEDMAFGKSYVGATNRNNGVLSFVQKNAKLIQKGNAIGFIKNGNGSAGYAIYKHESFISTSDVIFAYADWLNKYNGLFITTCSDMSEEKYSHGYKWTKERLVKSGIMLPVNEKGSPDYEFMEQYGKQIMLQKYQQYLNYISART